MCKDVTLFLVPFYPLVTVCGIFLVTALLFVFMYISFSWTFRRTGDTSFWGVLTPSPAQLCLGPFFPSFPLFLPCSPHSTPWLLLRGGHPGQKPCMRRPESSWEPGLPIFHHSLARIVMGMNKLCQLPPLLSSLFTFPPSEHLRAMWGILLFSYLSHALTALSASSTFSHMETDSTQLLWLLVVGPHPHTIEIPGDTCCLSLLGLPVGFWFCCLTALPLFMHNEEFPKLCSCHQRHFPGVIKSVYFHWLLWITDSTFTFVVSLRF